MWLDFPLFISERYSDGFVVAMFRKISATTKGVLKVPAMDLLRMSCQPAASSPEFGCSDMARWRRGLQAPATPCTAATTLPSTRGHRHLLRERGWRDAGHGASQHEAARAAVCLRDDLAVQPGAAQGHAQPVLHHRQAHSHGGVHRDGTLRYVQKFQRGDGRLPQGRGDHYV